MSGKVEGDCKAVRFSIYKKYVQDSNGDSIIRAFILHSGCHSSSKVFIRYAD